MNIHPNYRLGLAAHSVTGFRKRTNQEHRALGDQYRRLGTKAARKKFVTEYASRWSELARLPYFDLCRMIVIDPMHNLFLGLVSLGCIIWNTY